MTDPTTPKEGLFPIIAQDADTGEVLLLAWGNEGSLHATEQTGWMHYWSRSRGKLWRKGEESGNGQRVVSLTWDCDRDALLAKVRPQGPACHTGAYTCFGEPLHGASLPEELWAVFRQRQVDAPPGSYVAKLLADPGLLRKKLGEEAIELILASQEEGHSRVVHEAADLLFHVLLLLYQEGVPFQDVADELKRRRK